MTITSPRSFEIQTPYVIRCDKCTEFIAEVTDLANVESAVERMGGWYEITGQDEIILCRECAK